MKYLACQDGALNPETGVCSAEVWVDAPSWQDGLPTLEQANEVGIAFFVSLVGLYVAKRLLTPDNDRTE